MKFVAKKKWSRRRNKYEGKKIWIRCEGRESKEKRKIREKKQ